MIHKLIISNLDNIKIKELSFNSLDKAFEVYSSFEHGNYIIDFISEVV